MYGGFMMPAGGGWAAAERLRAGLLELPNPWGRTMTAVQDLLTELEGDVAPASVPGAQERRVRVLLEQLEGEWWSSPVNRSSKTQRELEESRRRLAALPHAGHRLCAADHLPADPTFMPSDLLA